jgi:hypothetical protein
MGKQGCLAALGRYDGTQDASNNILKGGPSSLVNTVLVQLTPPTTHHTSNNSESEI